MMSHSLGKCRKDDAGTEKAADVHDDVEHEHGLVGDVGFVIFVRKILSPGVEQPACSPVHRLLDDRKEDRKNEEDYQRIRSDEQQLLLRQV